MAEHQNYSEAEPMLLECHARLKNNPDTPPTRLNETVTALAQLYESTNAPTKAARWRTKLPIDQGLKGDDEGDAPEVPAR